MPLDCMAWPADNESRSAQDNNCKGRGLQVASIKYSATDNEAKLLMVSWIPVAALPDGLAVLVGFATCIQPGGW